MLNKMDYMALALEQACLAADSGEVPVGAVVVDGTTGEVLAKAGNRVEALNDPTAHAEMLVLRAVCATKAEPRLPECDLYVTLEPCAMCAMALSHARIRRLVFGAYDPKSGGVEHGAKVFSHATCHHMPDIVGGMREEECGVMLKEFFQKKRLPEAMFGAGCFWGVEAAFRRLPGVVDTAVGYSGGFVDHPDYRTVCTGHTGHAEVVRVRWDPAQISYEDLLDIFWNCHDPTQLNRQGQDVGNQYRSAIFYYDDVQKQVAERSKAERVKTGCHNDPIVTEITAAGPFWRAEDYHQRYLDKRRGLL